MKYWIALAISSPCLVLGCDSTGVGNPRSEMSVTVVNELRPEPDAADTGDQLTASELKHAVLAFSELQWIPCDPADASIVTPGPIVVDLVSGYVNPPLPPVPMAPGGYCGLDAPLSTYASDAVMQGRSMLFSGARSDGTRFLMYAAMLGTLHMRPSSNLSWNTDNAGSVIWALRPLRWLRQTELDAEASDAFGAAGRAIVIDIDRHPLLYSVIRSRIGERSTLHTDLNGNHQLEPNEISGDALIGQGLPNLD